MAGDMVELIPLSEQDEAIYAAWETGKGLRTLARDFGVSVGQVEQALDRTLPAFDSQNQLRAFKRELRRLEDLSGEFYALAKRDKNHDSAHLFARLNERICSMRGWNAPIKMDPLTVQVAERELHEFDRVYEAILKVARAGNDGASEAPGAVGVLSDSGEKMPND